MNKSSDIKEALILAGGLGTRLRGVIGEFPKPLAPINGVPFLQYLLDYLHLQEIPKVVLSVGYKWELIEEAFGKQYKDIELVYSVEETPLGTGGAIRLGLEKIAGSACFVLNGDTIFDVPLKSLAGLHIERQSACTLSLKELEKIDRYGTIEVDQNNLITAFREKAYADKAFINGGVYCLEKTALNVFNIGERFSFETEFLSEINPEMKLYGKAFTGYFKDIGIPSDYNQFEADVLSKTINLISS